MDKELQGHRIEHLQILYAKLNSYCWVFLCIIALPLMTPILFCMLHRLVKVHFSEHMAELYEDSHSQISRLSNSFMSDSTVNLGRSPSST